MKQIKAIVFTAIITLLTLGTVVYTSCRKDHCKTLDCRNGGACNDGFCFCASGYTGVYCEVPNVASVALQNKTFTTVYLNIAGVDYTVDSGKTLTFTGGFGDTLKGTAYVHGVYGINVPLAPLNVAYPTSNTRTQTLDVSGNYFFLKVVNNSPTLDQITQVHVNYLQRQDKLDIVQIPNNGVVHNIGYYMLFSDTHVHIGTTPYFEDFNSLGLSATGVNLVYTAVYH